MASLRSAVIRLAHSKPELRPYLLPMLKEAAPMTLRALLKLIKFPPPDLTGEDDGGWASWSRRGGYAGRTAINRTIDAAKAAGFKHQTSSDSSSPDASTVGGVDRYSHPDGYVLEASARYGETKARNYFNLSVSMNQKARLP